MIKKRGLFVLVVLVLMMSGLAVGYSTESDNCNSDTCELLGWGENCEIEGDIDDDSTAPPSTNCQTVNDGDDGGFAITNFFGKISDFKDSGLDTGDSTYCEADQVDEVVQRLSDVGCYLQLVERLDEGCGQVRYPFGTVVGPRKHRFIFIDDHELVLPVLKPSDEVVVTADNDYLDNLINHAPPGWYFYTEGSSSSKSNPYSSFLCAPNDNDNGVWHKCRTKTLRDIITTENLAGVKQTWACTYDSDEGGDDRGYGFVWVEIGKVPPEVDRDTDGVPNSFDCAPDDIMSYPSFPTGCETSEDVFYQVGEEGSVPFCKAPAVEICGDGKNNDCFNYGIDGGDGKFQEGPLFDSSDECDQNKYACQGQAVLRNPATGKLTTAESADLPETEPAVFQDSEFSGCTEMNAACSWLDTSATVGICCGDDVSDFGETDTVDGGVGQTHLCLKDDRELVGMAGMTGEQTPKNILQPNLWPAERCPGEWCWVDATSAVFRIFTIRKPDQVTYDIASNSEKWLECKNDGSSFTEGTNHFAEGVSPTRTGDAPSPLERANGFYCYQEGQFQYSWAECVDVPSAPDNGIKTRFAGDSLFAVPSGYTEETAPSAIVQVTSQGYEDYYGTTTLDSTGYDFMEFMVKFETMTLPADVLVTIRGSSEIVYLQKTVLADVTNQPALEAGRWLHVKTPIPEMVGITSITFEALPVASENEILVKNIYFSKNYPDQQPLCTGERVAIDPAGAGTSLDNFQGAWLPDVDSFVGAGLSGRAMCNQLYDSNPLLTNPLEGVAWLGDEVSEERRCCGDDTNEYYGGASEARTSSSAEEAKNHACWNSLVMEEGEKVTNVEVTGMYAKEEVTGMEVGTRDITITITITPELSSSIDIVSLSCVSPDNSLCMLDQIVAAFEEVVGEFTEKSTVPPDEDSDVINNVYSYSLIKERSLLDNPIMGTITLQKSWFMVNDEEAIQKIELTQIDDNTLKFRVSGGTEKTEITPADFGSSDTLTVDIILTLPGEITPTITTPTYIDFTINAPCSSSECSYPLPSLPMMTLEDPEKPWGYTFTNSHPGLYDLYFMAEDGTEYLIQEPTDADTDALEDSEYLQETIGKQTLHKNYFTTSGNLQARKVSPSVLFTDEGEDRGFFGCVAPEYVITHASDNDATVQNKNYCIDVIGNNFCSFSQTADFTTTIGVWSTEGVKVKGYKEPLAEPAEGEELPLELVMVAGTGDPANPDQEGFRSPDRIHPALAVYGRNLLPNALFKEMHPGDDDPSTDTMYELLYWDILENGQKRDSETNGLLQPASDGSYNTMKLTGDKVLRSDKIALPPENSQLYLTKQGTCDPTVWLADKEGNIVSGDQRILALGSDSSSIKDREELLEEIREESSILRNVVENVPIPTDNAVYVFLEFSIPKDSSSCTIYHPMLQLIDPNNPDAIAPFSYNEDYQSYELTPVYGGAPMDNPTEEQKHYPRSAAACCPDKYCWNGFACIEPMGESTVLAETIPGQAGEEERTYRCIEGSWDLIPQQYDWFGEKKGFCPAPDQCFVVSSLYDVASKKKDLTKITASMAPEDGFINFHTQARDIDGNAEDVKFPTCIQQDEFILDHYCAGEGEWTSRTKYLAEGLLSGFEKDGGLDDDAQFTLSCTNPLLAFTDLTHSEVITGIAPKEVITKITPTETTDGSGEGLDGADSGLSDPLSGRCFNVDYSKDASTPEGTAARLIPERDNLCINSACILKVKDNAVEGGERVILATSLNQPLESNTFMGVLDDAVDEEISCYTDEAGVVQCPDKDKLLYLEDYHALVYGKEGITGSFSFGSIVANILDAITSLFATGPAASDLSSPITFIQEHPTFQNLYINKEQPGVTIFAERSPIPPEDIKTEGSSDVRHFPKREGLIAQFIGFQTPVCSYVNVLTQNRDMGTEAPFHAAGLELPRLACTEGILPPAFPVARIEAVANAEDEIELQKLDNLWINLMGKIRINENKD